MARSLRRDRAQETTAIATSIATLARGSRAGALVLGGAGALLAGFLLWPAAGELIERWSQFSLYSRAVIVPLFSASLAWEVRRTLVGARPEWSRLGAVLGAAGLSLLSVAVAADNLTLTALSLPLLVGGLATLLLGRERARALAFPIALLGLMAPWPRSVLPAVSLALQTAAAVATHAALAVAGVASQRDGTSILLPGVTIDINETCNGLAFLMAMLVIGVVFAWRTQPTIRRGAGLVALACAAALVANWIRVTGTAWIAFSWGPRAATGIPHMVLGESVYMVTVAVFTVLVGLETRRTGRTVGVRPERAQRGVAERPA